MDAGKDQREEGTTGGPLSGLRVLDLTAVVLGPFATQIMGDYGAEIVKVESPSGDLMRLNGVSLHRGMSSIFLALNRNKKSIALDLQKPDGKAVLRRMIPQFDVLVHNMRTEAIERLGFGYDAARALKPDIVYCAATGFDEDGPDAGRPAFDDIIQAGSGLAAIASLGRATPDYVASLIADKTTGMAVVNAVLAALWHRARTGEGQYVEVPMLETMASFVLTEHLGGLTFPDHLAPAGYARLMEGGRKPVRTSDGAMAILPYSAQHWRDFFTAAGRPEIAETYAHEDRAKRNENNAKLYAALQEIGPSRSTAEWMAICTECDVPATPLFALGDLPEHPQLKAVGFFQSMDHPSEGPIRVMRPAAKFGSTPAAIRSPAPLLGEHSSAILAEAGFSKGEIQRLRDTQIITQA